MEIVYHIIAVVTIGSKDRIEIEGIHAEVGQVVEPLLDACQVTAKELDQLGRVAVRQRRLAPADSSGRLAAVLEFAVANVVPRIAVGKAIGEDLVKDAVADPGRRIIIGQHLKIVGVGRRVAMQPRAVVPPNTVGSEQQEAVAGRWHGQAYLGVPPSAGRTGLAGLHRSQ